MTKKRVLLGLLAIVVVAVVVVTALGRNRGDDGLAVEVAAVDRTTVVQTVTATGKIQPMVQVNISADVSAKITRLGVDEGDWVEKGTLLVELDRERYLAEVESQEANLSAAQAQANLARENMVKAEKDYERSRQLFNSSLESQATLDTTYASAEVEKARYQSAQDQVEQAKAAVRQARDALSKTTIYAPMAGTISTLNKEVGEIALGSQFQEDVIMVVSNLQGMEALVDVDENDIVLVSVGDEAEIEVDALPDVKFKGQVTEIASSAKVSGQGTGDQRTEFEVKIAITDPGTPAAARDDRVGRGGDRCPRQHPRGADPVRHRPHRRAARCRHGSGCDRRAASRASHPTARASSRWCGWSRTAQRRRVRSRPASSARPTSRSSRASPRVIRWLSAATGRSAVT